MKPAAADDPLPPRFQTWTRARDKRSEGKKRSRFRWKPLALGGWGKSGDGASVSRPGWGRHVGRSRNRSQEAATASA